MMAAAERVTAMLVTLSQRVLFGWTCLMAAVAMASPSMAASTFSFVDTYSLKLYRGIDTTPGSEVRTLHPGETMTLLACARVFSPDTATAAPQSLINAVAFIFHYGPVADSMAATSTRYRMRINGLQNAGNGAWSLDTAAECGTWRVWTESCLLPVETATDTGETIIRCVFTPGLLTHWAAGTAADSWCIIALGSDDNGNTLAGGRTVLDTGPLACAFVARALPATTLLQFDTGTAAAHLDLRPRLPADSLPLQVIANADYDLWARADSLAGSTAVDTLWFDAHARPWLTLSDNGSDTALAARAVTGNWRSWSPVRGYAQMQDTGALGDTWNLCVWLDYPDSGGFDRVTAAARVWVARRGGGDTTTGSDSFVLTAVGATRRLQAGDLTLNALNDTWLIPADSNAVVLDLQVPDDFGTATFLRMLRLMNVATPDIGGNDLAALELWRDGGSAGFQGAGSDSFGGYLQHLGTGLYGYDTLAVAVPAGGARLFVVARLSATAGGDSEWCSQVPVDGIRLGANRGPADTAVWRHADTRLRMDFTPPAPAVGLLPADGTDTSSGTPLLRWTAATDTLSGLAHYLIRLDTTAAFTSPRTDTTATASLTPATELWSCTWYWQVTAVDRAGNMSASATAWLRVDTVPPVVALTAPAHNAEIRDTHPLLQYSAVDAVTGVFSCSVQLDTTAAFTSPLQYDTISMSLRVPAQLSYDTWYWRVRATDTAGNQSDWSGTRAFAVSDTVNIRVLAAGIDTTVVQVGTMLDVEVLARAANRDPLTAESLVLAGSANITGDTCRLRLTESGANSSIFTHGGLLLSDTYAGGDSVAMTAVGSLLSLQCGNGTAAVGITRRLTLGGIRFTDAAFADTSGCRIPGPLFCEVTDPDRNFNPHLRDSFTVIIFNPQRTDTETLLLTESTETSCAFRSGGLPVSDTRGSAVGDGWLLSAAGDTVHGRYSDAGSGEQAEDSVVVFRSPATGTVRLTTAAFADTTAVTAGMPVYAEIADADGNRNPRQRDTVPITWWTGTDTEDTLAVETTDTSGLFRLTVGLFLTTRATGAAAMNDGLFYLPGPATLFLRYTDPLHATDSGTDSAAATLSVATAHVTTSAYVDTTTAYAPAWFYLQVADGNNNTRRSVADTLQVTVRTLRNGDSELVTLTESGASTGLFRATLWLSDTTGNPWPTGVLMTEIRDTALVNFADPYDAADSCSDSVPVERYPVNAVLQFVDEALADTTTVYVPRPLRVQVSAPDNNLSSLVADTLWVILASNRRGETETLLLTETTDTSGLFRSMALPTTDTYAVNPGDSIIICGVGDTVFFIYSDLLDAADRRGDSVSVVRRLTAADTMRLTNALFADTGTLLTGDSISAELGDADRNFDPQRPDTVVIPVWNRRTGDTEMLILTETSDTSGLFRRSNGLTVSAFAGFAAYDDFLLAGDGDTLELLYVDSGALPLTDTVTVHAREEQAVVRLVRADSTVADTFIIGTQLYAQAVEYDGNRDPLATETIAVQAVVRSSGDTETLILREAGTASWLFHGTSGLFLSDDASWAQTQEYGLLLASDSALIELLYHDATSALDSAVAHAVARAETGSARLADRYGVDTPAFFTGRRVHCRVGDSDENDNPWLADTLFVTLTSGRDTEHVMLTETAPASGQFWLPEDQFPILARHVGSLVDDGILWAKHGDTITLIYLDPDGGEYRDTYARVLENAGSIWNSDSVGDMVDTVAPGHYLYPWLYDPDGNVRDTCPDTIAVMYYSPPRGDAEYVVLMETGDSTGLFGNGSETVFVSWSAAVAAAEDNGLLHACVGDTIWLRLSDREEAVDTASIALAVVASRAGMQVTDTTHAVRSLFTFDDSLAVSLYNPESNLDPLTIDMVAVAVTCTATADTEIMVLTESGKNTALFRAAGGGIPLSSIAQLAVNDGILLASDSAMLTVTFEDSATTGEVVSAAAVVSHRPHAANATAADSAVAGGIWMVSVVDTDANRHPLQAETVAVTVWSLTTADTETLVLSETGETTAIFVGYLWLSDTRGSTAGDGLLMAGGGESLAVRYQDARWAADSASAAGSVHVVPTPAMIVLAETVQQGGPWVVTVIDTDRNRHPRAPDTLMLTVRSWHTGDTDSLVLTETGDTSCRFTAAGPYLSDTTGGGTGNGILLVAIGDTLQAQYFDTPTAGDSAAATTVTTEAAKSSWLQADSSTVAIGARVWATLGDSDANRDPLAAETAVVTVWCAATGDTETLVLAEDDAVAERFRAGLWTSDTAGNMPGNGLLLVAAGETIALQYLDAKGTGDSAMATCLAAEYFTPARIWFAADSSAAADTAFLWVADTNANRRPTLRDTVVVSAFAPGTADTETVVLWETTETSAWFSGGITLSDTVGGMVEDGWLMLGRHDTAYALYRDARDATDSRLAQTRLRPTPSAAFLLLGDTQPWQDASWSITLADTDANCRPRGADTVTVVLACVATGDSETVILTEIGDTAAIFTASVAFISDTAGETAGDGLLLAGRADTVSVTYLDQDDGGGAADMLIVRERLKPCWVYTDNPSMSVGGIAVLTVGDSDANADPLLAETVAVTVLSMFTGDSETVTCTESGPRSERFVGSVPVSDTAGAGGNDGILLARSLDTVMFTYNDARTPSDSDSMLFVLWPVPSPSHLVLGAGSCPPGGAVAITVADSDKNIDPRSRDTVAVTVYDQETADTETIVLTETTDTSARFAGNCPLSDTAGGLPGDGVLMVGQHDTVVIRYDDPTVVSDSSTGSCTVLRTASAMTLHAETAPVGGWLAIVLDDPDGNADPRAPDTRLIVARCLRTGDSETLLLYELSDTAGIFSGMVPVSDTVAATTGDGVLLAGAIDTITISGSDDIAGDTALLVVPTVEGRKAASLHFATAACGTVAMLVATDSDANRDVLAADTVSVAVTCAATGDSETAFLSEDSVRAERFSGGVLISDTYAVTLGDGVLVAGIGDTLMARYVDALTPEDSAVATGVVTPFLRPCTAAFAAVSFSLLAPVSMLVTDPNANHQPLLADTLTVTVHALAGDDTETLTLTETAVASGIFAGSIMSSDTAGAMPQDGLLLTGGVDTVSLRYFDADDPADSAVAHAAIIRAYRAAQVLLPADTLMLPCSVTVQVIDADGNRAPRRPDTVSVSVASNAPDTETLVLTETTDTSSVFVATIVVAETQGLAIGDGMVAAGRGMLLSVHYADAEDGTDSATDSATLTAPRRAATGALARVRHARTDDLVLTISDADANLQPLAPDTLFASARCAATGDSELLLLTETAPASGIFTLAGFDLSDTMGAVVGDGTLHVRLNDSFTVIYVDAGDATDSWGDTGVVQSMQAVAALWLWPAAWSAGETAVIGGVLWVQMQDTDENRDPDVQDSVTVTLSAARVTDTETVVLHEIGTASGWFRSTSGISLVAAAAAPNDGVLQSFSGDTPLVIYADADSGSMVSDSITVWPARTAAAADFTDAAFAPVTIYYLETDTPWLHLQDGDANLHAWLPDTVTVTLHSGRGDSETLTLTESGVNTGVFRGGGIGFDTGAVTAQDGKAQVEDGIRFWLQYQDARDASDSAIRGITVYRVGNSIAGLRCEVGGTADTWWLDLYLLDASGDSLPGLTGYALTAAVVSGTTTTGVLHDTAVTVVGGTARLRYTPKESATPGLLVTVGGKVFRPVLALVPGRDTCSALTAPRGDTAVGLTVIFPFSLVARGCQGQVLTYDGLHGEDTVARAAIDGANAGFAVPGRQLLFTAGCGHAEFKVEVRDAAGNIVSAFPEGALQFVFNYPDTDADGYIDGSRLPETTLALYTLTGGRWAYEPGGSVDPGRNLFTVELAHLSLFALAGGRAVSDLELLNVYPNPFRPNAGLGHRYVTFDNLPAGSRIRIFTVAAEPVADFTVPATANRVAWDGTNERGEKVASGVYVWLVTSDGRQRTGKVMVIR